jgi:hypothetical protein
MCSALSSPGNRRVNRGWRVPNLVALCRLADRRIILLLSKTRIDAWSLASVDYWPSLEELVLSSPRAFVSSDSVGVNVVML